MKYERLTKEMVGSFGYDLKDFEHKPKEFNDYDAFYAYKMAVKRLGELEDKIESGELVNRNSYLDYLMAAKNTLELTDKEIEFFAKHNARVRTSANAEIARLTAENAELRARLEKAVEPPVKVGDTVYFIPTYNGKPIWGVQRGIVQMVGITRQGYHVKIRDRANFNKTYMFGKSAFLSKEQAEAKLKEKKEKDNG